MSRGHSHGSCFAFLLFRIHQGLWFCYVFLASLTLDFAAQKFSLHHAPNMYVYVIKTNSLIPDTLYIILWQIFTDVDFFMISNFQMHTHHYVTYMGVILYFAPVVFSHSNFSTYKPLWYIQKWYDFQFSSNSRGHYRSWNIISQL